MQALASKMYKATNCYSEHIMNEICQLRDNRNYNLRHTSQFVITLINTCFRSSRSQSLFSQQLYLKETLAKVLSCEY